MFISSSRLRRVDAPDAPAAGGVPPVEPPVPAPAAVATPAPEAGPAAPKKPLSKGLLVGIIAGGGLLVILAIVALFVLVLPSILGGGSTDKVDVVDIGAEPDTTWEYDFVGDNDEDYIETSPNVVAVGADQALVWATFDYYSFESEQGDSAGWYEGYNEQYADGYAAGLEYQAAYDLWWDDLTYTIDQPDDESYFPDGAYNNYEEWLGFQDGFSDAYYEYEEGYSEKVKPADPDYTPTLALLNSANGDEAWSIDLTDAIDGVDYQSDIQAYDIEGSSAALVVASVVDDGETTYVAVTLNKGNGEVISTLESDGPISARGFAGDVILSVSDEDGEETTVGRYSINAIDDDAKWEESVDGLAQLYIDGAFVSVYGDDDYLVLDANTGEEAAWGDDVDSDVYYSFLGSQLIRFEDGEIEGYNTNGDSTWEDSVDAEYSFASDGALFVAEEDGDVYTELQRINPSNGSEQWSEAYDDEFDYVLGVQGSSVLLASGSSIVVLDLGSGEEKFTQKAGEFYGAWEGASQYYVYTGDELAAYSYGDKGDVWTLDVDDNEGITVIGQHLVLIDYDDVTLHGLAP